ncbi:MAG TPA: OmpA family protein [Anaeromyxobacteraceae bacterium]|jgi:outer membrane protein OmpA-like peptidoglycan-associated protein|nr:OmpA family protein [Anaeromyxobacteraceae bacterium]
MSPRLLLALALSLAPALASSQSAWDLGKKAVGGAAVGKLEKEINKRLLAESRKNQCSFKTDADELAPGCDPKAKRLANALVDAKKRLKAAGVENFKFEVSGHTDTSGSASHNKDLSQRRAERMKKELAAKGIPDGEIAAVGVGADQPLVKPDDTAAKKAKNRRYEVRVRL